MSARQQPLYLISRKNEIVEENRPAIEVAVTSGESGLLIAVTPEVVQLNDVSGPTNLVAALQHFPHYIDKMLFGIRFAFRPHEDMAQLMPEAQWKLNSVYHHWFYQMKGMAMMPFFVQDADIRLYMLAGDYSCRGLISCIQHGAGSAEGKLRFKPHAMKQLTKRVLNSCYQFLAYCHGSGVDPKPAIEIFIAQYNLPVHYNVIYKEYQKDISKNAASWRSLA